MPALTLHKLKKHFGGIRAVDGISLHIEPGTFVGIIGPNGSGKSTLLHLLTGVQTPTSGTIQVGAHALLPRMSPEHLLGLGITRTFQEVRILEQMTVLENMLVVLGPRSAWKALVQPQRTLPLKKAELVLKRVRLWEQRHSFASELSYGQRKLLEIARALLVDVPIYLFDEPFAGLFPEMVRHIVDILHELHAAGKTILLIEHDMALVRALADRIIVMDAGGILADGKPDDVLARPNVIDAYLGQ